jgi:homoserine O-acetyltransferase
MNSRFSFSLALCFWVLLADPAAAQEQKFAQLGDFKLENGETPRDCRIGYRTLGQLNADRSNVLLFPTWAGGTSQQLLANAGPGKLADTSRYFVVLVDALSNGVSSSPSNSSAQPHMHFPKIGIGDMVNTQYALLTKELHIQRVHAVMGISMGGMQTFQWMAAYPDFMNYAVPIVGAPRLAPYTLLHWQTLIDVFETDPSWNGGDYTSNPGRGAAYEFGGLLLTTPEHFNQTNNREHVLEQIAKAKKTTGGFDVNDTIRQSEAMMSLDVAAPFGGSLERAAAAVKAKVLVVVSKTDQVSPRSRLSISRIACMRICWS